MSTYGRGPTAWMRADLPSIVTKEQAPCCVEQRDALGRLPVGFCGPFCVRRSMRHGETYGRSLAIWRDSEAVAS